MASVRHMFISVKWGVPYRKIIFLTPQNANKRLLNFRDKGFLLINLKEGALLWEAVPS